MKELVLIIHILVAVALIGLVLVQHGKGADMGAAFGGGASATLFGARGSANFLTRLTAGLAAVFFITSLVLAWMYGQGGAPRSVTEQPAAEVQSVPAAPKAPEKLSDVPEAPK
ncbi:MAG: preprotein translocase subunit SecG [Candidatus Muproteobacteria bacterium RBG_16_65_31]|uniref:Protein-export membrane protein SecG n=1 Tax=Candidatus Muproteobacteria bacterium RBG_16_65_31 TaxID=1817759 RepID=A0A1F6TIX7_9PROT|nr:MAG: preprotein translocase subunit SecG [Candidatus Muproteobacteria bacterium RBG_16_65_31]